MAAKLKCSVAAIAVGAVRFHLFCQKFFPTGVHHRRVFIIVVIVFLLKVKHISSNLNVNEWIIVFLEQMTTHWENTMNTNYLYNSFVFTCVDATPIIPLESPHLEKL